MDALLNSLNPFALYANLRDFLETGGDVLFLIMIVTFFMWVLIIERYWYFLTAFPSRVKEKLDIWGARSDHSSWHAHKIRTAMISELRLDARNQLGTIKTLVAIAPLLGLLGTVTGMVEVFDVMAVTGASNARAMASGVSKATIPTMAGMVVAISGIYFSFLLERRARRSIQKVEDELVLS